MNIKIDYIYNKLKKYDYKIDNQINLYTSKARERKIKWALN